MEIEEVRNVLRMVYPKNDLELFSRSPNTCNIRFKGNRLGILCKCNKSDKVSLTLFGAAPYVSNKLYVEVYDIFNKVFELDLNELPSVNWDYHVFILSYRN